jgi:hypothetical protein
VLPGLVEHLGVHARQQRREDVRAQSLQVDDAHAGDRVEDAGAQRVRVRVGRSLEAEPEVLPQSLRELPATQEPALVGRPREVDRARALDERLVEIEEGSGFRHRRPIY